MPIKLVENFIPSWFAFTNDNYTDFVNINTVRANSGKIVNLIKIEFKIENETTITSKGLTGHIYFQMSADIAPFLEVVYQVGTQNIGKDADKTIYNPATKFNNIKKID